MMMSADILCLACYAIRDNRLLEIGRSVFCHLELHVCKARAVVHGGKFFDRMKRVVVSVSLLA